MQYLKREFQKEMLKVAQSFNKLDKDKNGVLDQEELKELMQHTFVQAAENNL